MQTQARPGKVSEALNVALFVRQMQKMPGNTPVVVKTARCLTQMQKVAL
jgi:hypothetical protein